MALRVDYLARETGQNLVRNPLPTIAAITTVGVALTMLAVSLLARSGIDNAFQQWNNDVTFIVYMNSDASQSQIDSLRKELEQSPQIDQITYLNHSQSFAQAKRLFADEPELLQVLNPGDLPTSFRVKPKNPDAKIVEDVARSFAAKPGVYKVDFERDAVRAVQRIGGKLQGFLLTGSIVLAVASVLLIFNTIQTAIFARRREIEVMRLVGASNWYIRVPFIMEGLVQGLAGSAFACFSAWLFTHVWRSSFTGRSVATLFNEISWTNGKLWWTALSVSLIGSAISAVVAFVSTTWYLRA